MFEWGSSYRHEHRVLLVVCQPCCVLFITEYTLWYGSPLQTEYICHMWSRYSHMGWTKERPNKTLSMGCGQRSEYQIQPYRGMDKSLLVVTVTVLYGTSCWSQIITTLSDSHVLLTYTSVSVSVNSHHGQASDLWSCGYCNLIFEPCKNLTSFL